MNIDFGIPRTLIMQNIANIWNIKTSSRHIGTNQYCTCVNSCLNLIDSSFKLLQILESLPLLHFGMQTVILNLEEVQQTVKTSSGCDSITEDDDRLSSLLLQVVVKVEVLLITFATDKHLGQRSGHLTSVLFLSEIDDLGGL
jgi:hypothetical protein